jgi:hypothetical protein
MGTYVLKKYEHQFYCSRPNPHTYVGIPVNCCCVYYDYVRQLLRMGWRNFVSTVLERFLQPTRAVSVLTWRNGSYPMASGSLCCIPPFLATV